ncbi:MAG TPA: hypothetical protein VGI71_01405 [Scandinavium sp.]
MRKPPAGSDMVPVDFFKPVVKTWPADLGWEPDEGDEGKVEQYASEAEELKIKRHEYLNTSFVFVTRGSEVVDLNLPPSLKPFALRDWQNEHRPRVYLQRRHLELARHIADYVYSSGGVVLLYGATNTAKSSMPALRRSRLKTTRKRR